jgi:hypothetical protein
MVLFSISFSKSHLKISFKRVTFLVLQPLDEKILARVGVWESMLFHQGRVNLSYLYHVFLILNYIGT